MSDTLDTEITWESGRLLGRHYLADFTGCPVELISSVGSIEQMFIDVLKRHGATVLSHTSHQFEPFGATIVVLLAESHASLHTWPENESVCIDMFTCSAALDANAAIEELARVLSATSQAIKTVNRVVPE